MSDNPTAQELWNMMEAGDKLVQTHCKHCYVEIEAVKLPLMHKV